MCKRIPTLSPCSWKQGGCGIYKNVSCTLHACGANAVTETAIDSNLKYARGFGEAIWKRFVGMSASPRLPTSFPLEGVPSNH